MQETCVYENVYENFSSRNTEFRVVVGKIWPKEVCGAKL
jgi:hypothetical protein